MINRFRLIGLLWLIICLGGMTAVWVRWDPQSELQQVLWWVAEIGLGVLAFQALAALIMAGGLKKQFRDS